MSNNSNKKAAIESLQLQHLLSISNVSLVISVLLALILVYMQWEVIPAPKLLIWCPFIVLAFLARTALIFAYQGSPAKDGFAIHNRLMKFRVVIFASSLAWGSAGILLFPANDTQHQMFLIFMLAGLTTGGVTSFSADLPTATIFSVSVNVPLIIRLLIAGDNMSLAMAMAVTLYLGFMIASSQRTNRSILENLSLRLDAAAREETLKVSALRYQLLFQSSRDALMVLAPPLWKFTGANQATLQLFGVSSEAEFTEFCPWDVSPERQPDGAISRDKAHEMIALATSKGSHFFEWEYRRLNGQAFHADVLLNRMEVGDETFLQATVRNISKRKQAEDKLALFRFAIDKSTLPLYWITKDGQFFDVNEKACSQLGYTREEFIGKFIWDIDPDYKPGDRPKAWSTIKEEKISTFERRHRRKDGTMIPVEITANFIAYEGKEFVITFAQNIIERKLAETDLRIAATAFESQQPIIITDFKSVIQRVNKAFTNSTGYAPEEVVGQTPRLFKSGIHDANFYQAMWDSIAQNGTWQGEIWDRRKNGEIYPKWLTISSVKGDDGIVTHYVGTHLDITERKEAEAKIRQLAFHDPLTQLPNRQLLLDRLRHALASSVRSGRKGALLFIDLDNFKTLNDTLGHVMGDMLLKQVAERLATSVREGDTVARLGGDEFVVMLEDLSEQAIDAAEHVEVIGEKILAVVSEDYRLGTQAYRITTSIGATLFLDHQQDTEELLKQADIAMYQAKKAGRNTLRFFDRKMQEAINTRVALEGELQKALDDRQFRLHYQVQVDSSGRAFGAEVLLRWIHPERGMVSPAQFIPLAEETGLILPIGLWVLETACTQLKSWTQQEQARNLVLSVNISARQFHQTCFVEQVRAAVKRHAINPNLLKLELTESLLLENTEDTIATMNDLKAIGVQLSLDDFGTGYSSLQYLKMLPLDQIKIDRSFVQDITTDANDAAIVQTIIAMTEALGLDVIAEGVETEEQLEFLNLRGCSAYQGYLFGKPVSIEEFEAKLRQA